MNPKAMPVLLVEKDEERWLICPFDEAVALRIHTIAGDVVDAALSAQAISATGRDLVVVIAKPVTSLIGVTVGGQPVVNQSMPRAGSIC